MYISIPSIGGRVAESIDLDTLIVECALPDEKKVFKKDKILIILPSKGSAFEAGFGMILLTKRRTSCLR